MLQEVRIRGFRSVRDVRFAPPPVCALVGEASVGKSNVLTAIWTLLDPAAPTDDAEVTATLASGVRLELRTGVRRGEPPRVVFRRARLRGIEARALVDSVEARCRAGERGLVLLVEEPELYLRPQAQRYLYRLLRSFAELGNQVIYSTHAPAFLNVGRLDELALVEHHGAAGTVVVQPPPLPADETFRALSEFDAERSELFLSRATLLVEGRTEKLVFPLVFRALGHDPDREAISIVECGGKPNIAVVARVCDAARIPYVVVHDRDAPAGREPIAAERAVNHAIALVAGPDRVIELAPDFESVAGLQSHSHKPAQALRRFAEIAPDDVPAPLAEAVARVLALARD